MRKFKMTKNFRGCNFPFLILCRREKAFFNLNKSFSYRRFTIFRYQNAKNTLDPMILRKKKYGEQNDHEN